jgi:NAD-reducing hydrogenase large subunit
MGYPEGVYRVGPLGRLNAVEKLDTPLAQKEFEEYRAMNAGKPVENTLHYHYARLIETLFAIEKVKVLLDDPDIMGKDILNTRHNFKGEGVGVIEAPRGTLLHHYVVRENGQVMKVNLIVSTGHNNWAMSEAVDSVAKTYITGPDIREGLLNRVEAAIRAHDPCLSCSTHAVGQMPMLVDINDAEGNLIKTLRRDA